MIIFQFLGSMFVGIFFTSLVRDVLPTEYNIALMLCSIMCFCTVGITAAIERTKS